MRRVTAGLLLTVVLLGSTPGVPASAAPGSGAAAQATYGIRPTRDRPTFAYAATPAAVLTDQVEISNAGTTALTLHVYASDAFNPRAGGFDLLAAGQRPTDVGSWITMARATVRVPARGKVLVPFTMRIPAAATPGDHSGGIVAALTSVRSDASGARVAVEQRVGARIYLRISGALQAGLAVEGLTARFRPGLNPFGGSRTLLTYRVRNTGNVRVGVRQRVTVGALWGGDHDAGEVLDVPEILPGNSVDVTAEVRDAFPGIRLTGTVRAEPQSQPGDQALPMTATTRQVGFWAISWTLLGPIALLIAVVALIWWRRRRRHAPETPAVPDATTSPAVAVTPPAVVDAAP